MCRLRFPGGIVTSHQFRGVADIAEQYGGGYTDVTTRANLQIREIQAADVVTRAHVASRPGHRASGRGGGQHPEHHREPHRGHRPPGVDRHPPARPRIAPLHPEPPRDVRPAAKVQHRLRRRRDDRRAGGDERHRLHRRAGRARASRSPRASISAWHSEGSPATRTSPATPACCSSPRSACRPPRRSSASSSRTATGPTARKARLKYVLDRWGLERYIEETEKQLPAPFRRLPLEECEPRTPAVRGAHIGFHPQRQPGLVYVGVVLPVGRMSCDQMRGLAAIADRHGSGTIRLTVWQNLLISDIPEDRADQVKAQIEALGLGWKATEIRTGLVACTGNSGCKFSSSDTKRHALAIADYLDARLELDAPHQHPLDRLPELLRPALHRRHRPAGDQGRRGRRHGRGVSRLPRRRLRAGPGHRPRDLPRGQGRGRCPRSSSGCSAATCPRGSGPTSRSTSSPSGTRPSNSKTCSPRRTLYQVEVP